MCTVKAQSLRCFSRTLVSQGPVVESEELLGDIPIAELKRCAQSTLNFFRIVRRLPGAVHVDIEGHTLHVRRIEHRSDVYKPR